MVAVNLFSDDLGLASRNSACTFNLSSLLKQISREKNFFLEKISSFRRDPTSASAREFLKFLSLSFGIKVERSEIHALVNISRISFFFLSSFLR